MQKSKMKSTSQSTQKHVKEFVKCIPIIALAVVVLSLMAIAIRGKNDEWKYYDPYSATLHESDYLPDPDAAPDNDLVGFSNFREPSPAIKKLFEEVKADMRRELSCYTGLDWNRFETVPLVACDSVDKNGAFDEVEKRICIAESNLLKYEADKKEVLAHELFHALTPCKGYVAGFVYEGFTERMARTLYPETHSYIYWHGVMIADCLIEKYGIQYMIDLFSDLDEANAEINKLIGREYAIQKIAPLVYYSYKEFSQIEDENVIMDVICHLAANLDCDNTKDIRKYYDGADTSIKRYFNEILGD